MGAAAHLTGPGLLQLVQQLGGPAAVDAMTGRAIGQALQVNRRIAEQVRAAARAALALAAADVVPLRPAPAAQLREDEQPPDSAQPMEQQINEQRSRFDRLVRAQRVERVFNVPGSGPIGLVHFGDPHLDDDGCDLDLARRWLEVCRRPRVWGVNIGDTANSWAGRLARLYADQACTEGQAIERIRWFAESAPWLVWVLGNHDLWGQMRWIHREILRDADVRVVTPDDAQVCLRWPDGREFRLWARHSFKGHSQWNTLHGPMKAVRMNGYPADLYVDGHKHEAAIMTEPGPGGRVYTALRVRGFKRFDSYARLHQFEESSCGEACLTLIDPTASPLGRVRVAWTPEEAEELLRCSIG